MDVMDVAQPEKQGPTDEDATSSGPSHQAASTTDFVHRPRPVIPGTKIPWSSSSQTGDAGIQDQNNDTIHRHRTSGARRSQTFASPIAKVVSNLQEENPDDMILRLSNEFQPIVESGWDTVIYIGPPPQEHQQGDYEYEYIKQHFSRPYLMNSQTLKDSGSERFAKFLGPMSARAERKLKKLGIHNLLPSGPKPKYYIDLRPMQDEDEALLMITELTCTPGVLSWHTSHLASGIPRTLICGKDDLNITTKPHSRSWVENDDTATDEVDDEKMDTANDTATEATKDHILDLEPEYSSIRHYMAIERLLHTLAGNNPKLNSAPKVWTYYSIAKFFDCATNAKVTEWIYNWLFTSNNSNFIQANPEVAYRMAMGMRSPNMLKATFAMLVGERALMQAGRTTSDSTMINYGGTQVSTHGRTICHLDDDEINRIDHAAHSLTRRMTALFYSMANGPSASVLSTHPDLIKLDFLKEHYHDRELVTETYDLLLDYITGEIYQALSQNVQEGDLLRLYRTKAGREFGWLKRSQSFANSYNAMPLPQRLLTQSFWSLLENYGLYQELEKSAAWSRGHSLDGLSELAPGFEGELECVSKEDLRNTIDYMNLRIANDMSWSERTRAAWILIRQKTKSLGHQEHWVDQPHRDQELGRAIETLKTVRPPNVAGVDTFYNRPVSPRANVASGYLRTGPSLAVRPANLLTDLTMEMRSRIMREVLTPGYVGVDTGIESEISISQMDILLCLNDDEWKYLPLWADGLDDGSGGVFAEVDVPDMEGIEGFRGGKIGLGSNPGDEGSVGGSFSMAGDSEDFDEVMTDEGVSTVGRASRIATDGTTSAGASTVMSLDE